MSEDNQVNEEKKQEIYERGGQQVMRLKILIIGLVILGIMGALI